MLSRNSLGATEPPLHTDGISIRLRVGVGVIRTTHGCDQTRSSTALRVAGCAQTMLTLNASTHVAEIVVFGVNYEMWHVCVTSPEAATVSCQ